MYKVKEYFTDLQDNNYAYNPGDVFPRKGMKVSKKRLAELAGTENKRGIVLIEEVKKDVDADGDMPRTEELV